MVVFAIHWHELAMDLHVFPIPIPPPTSLPTPSLWVFPMHKPWAVVSCIQPGLVICFTLDNIHVSMLWYIYTMEYYSAIKNNSFESVLMRWMKLEPIIQSEEIIVLSYLMRGTSMEVTYRCESWNLNKAETKELMLSNCCVGEDSWESLGLQEDQTSQS